jgi:hypothetical protein
MPNELQDLMTDLELALVDSVDRLDQAEMRLLYVDVLELEQRVNGLHDALAFVADTIAMTRSSTTGRSRTSGNKPIPNGRDRTYRPRKA